MIFLGVVHNGKFYLIEASRVIEKVSNGVCTDLDSSNQIESAVKKHYDNLSVVANRKRTVVSIDDDNPQPELVQEKKSYATRTKDHTLPSSSSASSSSSTTLSSSSTKSNDASPETKKGTKRKRDTGRKRKEVKAKKKQKKKRSRTSTIKKEDRSSSPSSRSTESDSDSSPPISSTSPSSSSSQPQPSSNLTVPVSSFPYSSASNMSQPQLPSNFSLPVLSSSASSSSPAVAVETMVQNIENQVKLDCEMIQKKREASNAVSQLRLAFALGTQMKDV